MQPNFIHAGFGSYFNSQKILAVADYNSAPIRRLVRDSREQNKLIDLTAGHNTKSVLCVESGYIILSALSPNTMALRANGLAKE